MRRIPIRLRLTLAFAATITVVLAATGMFLYLHMGSDLDHSIDKGLRSRTGDIRALVLQADSGLRDATKAQGSRSTDWAQIVDGRGRVFDATAGLGQHSLLPAARLPQLSSDVMVQRVTVPAAGGPARLLATPVRAQGRRLIVIVAAPLGDRDRALADLRGLLLIGGPAALLLASLAGYALAAAALRPVDSMRRRAALISAEDLTQRLPLPPARDELQRLGETLNAMLDRLQGGLERERAFTADASHELRTPLTLLRTELELIARDHPSGLQLEAAVLDAVEDTDRLTRLVDDLLVLARAERDEQPIPTQAIPVADAFTAVMTRFPKIDEERQIDVTALGSLRVLADPDLLQRALSNMVENALTHGGGTIELSAEAAGAAVELHVRDRGTGFPPAFLPHAFERFARASAAPRHTGTGLGLAIVDVIARRLGGAARLANRPGGGADVWISIPAATSPATPRSAFGGSRSTAKSL
ncbi:MAG: ATP-binding protein [Candidatus Binatia bacterium]